MIDPKLSANGAQGKEPSPLSACGPPSASKRERLDWSCFDLVTLHQHSGTMKAFTAKVRHGYGLKLVLLTFVTAIAIGSDQEPVDTVEFTAHAIRLIGESNISERSVMKIGLLLGFSNRSDRPVVIPTGALQPELAFTGNSLDSRTITVDIMVSSRRGHSRRERVIPSLHSLLPVELRRGDYTEVMVTLIIPKAVILDKTNVSFRVDPELAQRFGLWSGTLRTTLVPEISLETDR